ncbi:dsDNA nuclease domain-containing protein [Synechocystis sp. FACHB-383]|uniref:dsDNA nuclease domain-containing protein n=1 Tax=Synechocystis sp. FACHB-383 TaxID=2692864 RepID=UPI0016894B09|nr:dsDNA nuclease domain-containing protein [Synechocystis sp. FACHB-383]
MESGGVIARRGFEFQDHVAAKYCLEMLQDTTLVAVWCESLDDITLVSLNGDQEEFEFIQAKNNEFNHFWSVAELCKRDKKKNIPVVGSSILEKSLAYERGSEPCRFRMVTSLPVNDELEVLTLPLSSPRRISPTDNFTKLCEQTLKKIPDYTSPNGSDASSWLSRVVWEVCHSSEALENANLLKLRHVGCALGLFLAEDQWNELYRKILRRIQDAGRAKWEADPEAKKLKRDDFLNWFQNLISKAQHPGVGSKGEQLCEKMVSAGISNDLIEVAQEQRRAYRSRTLNSGYMDLSRRQEIEMDTQAHLHQLVSKLDAGQLRDTGVEFHSRCLDCLSEVRQHDEGEISISFLQGYMYYLADRCLHRFMRATI